MNIASVTSPFADAEDTPWVIWQSQDRVSVLQEQVQLRDEDSAPAHIAPPELPPIHPAPPIKRMQYNTVMNRIVQASKKTGQYSAWTP